MKKILAAVFIASAFLSFAPVAKAQPLESNLRSKTMQIYYAMTVPANAAANITSTSCVLIDLSSTTVWPHKETRQVNITGVDIQLDKVAASSVTVQLGVVNFVNASTGSVTYFYSINSSSNVSNTNIEQQSYTDNQFRNLRVDPSPYSNFSEVNGVTPALLSNQVLNGSTIFQNDVSLPAPSASGITFPGVGDVVATIFNSDATNSVRVIIALTYHTEGN